MARIQLDIKEMQMLKWANEPILSVQWYVQANVVNQHFSLSITYSEIYVWSECKF